MLRSQVMSTTTSPLDITQYIPKTKSSLNFHVLQTDRYNNVYGSEPAPAAWTRLNIFEGTVVAGSPVMFCGGPVSALEWCPLPSDYNGPQYLAVSCLNDWDHNVKIGDGNEIKCVVQIWEWKTGKGIPHDTVRHFYSFVFDHGPVLSMRFCPSGGFIAGVRLGLLAVSSYCGDIFIFSLPTDHSPYLPRGSNNVSSHKNVIRLHPSLRLGLNVNNKNNVAVRQMVKVTWTKEKNHSIIAAGYFNGTVAIWNLLTESFLLRRTTPNGDFLLPQTTFQSYGGCITALDVFYVENSKWLMVASHKYVKMFELNTYGHPVEVSKLFPKTWISCGVWPLHWSSFIIGKDEAFHLMRNTISALQPLGIGFKQISLQTINSAVTDVTYSEWCNFYVACTESGDIYGCYFRDLLCNMARLDLRRLKFVSYTQTRNLIINKIYFL